MKLHSITYHENDETMLVVHLQDDSNKDILVLPFYHKKEDIEKEKRLEDSITLLPKLLEDLYNAGLKQDKIEFVKENIDV